MLENRSFDHRLGFSGISGTDPVASLKTSVKGFSGRETNSYNGKTSTVSHPAHYAMAVDPGHQFTDRLCQLSGADAKYTPGENYPSTDNSGFVAAHVEACSKARLQRDVAEILKCYSPEQLPVLNALAQESAVCDGWQVSMPSTTAPGVAQPGRFGR